MKLKMQASQQCTPTYLYGNNLYRWAMCQPLPIVALKWMTDFENQQDIPCILEVDLEYPKELHNLHDDYPLAAEMLMTNNVEKLFPNLNDKER